MTTNSISKGFRKAGWLAGLVLAGFTTQVQAAPVQYLVGLVTATLGYQDALGNATTATHEYAPAYAAETLNDYTFGAQAGSGMVSTLDTSLLTPFYADDGSGVYPANSFQYSLDNTGGSEDFLTPTLDIFVNLLFMSPQNGWIASAYTIGDWTLMLGDFMAGSPNSVFSTTFTFTDTPINEDSMYLVSSLGPGVYVTATFAGNNSVQGIGTIGGGLAPLSEAMLAGGAAFTSVTIDVPEPGSLALLGLGLVALVVVVRRRRESLEQSALAA